MKSISYLYDKFLLLALAIMSAFMVNSCDSASDAIALNVFSSSDDVKFGTQLDTEIRNNSKEYPLYTDAAANAYLQGIVDEIVKSPEIKYRNVFKYKVQIINTNTINAFAAPGGYIYVYKGLIKFLDNEASMAAVLAHEIGHADKRHATLRMTKQYGIELLLKVVLGENASELENIGANLLSGLALLKNSRDDEYEADEMSFKYLQSTKWYPGASKYFFDKIKKEEAGGTLTELLSTHPLSSERIAAVDALIKNANLSTPTEANLFTTTYANFKSTIK